MGKPRKTLAELEASGSWRAKDREKRARGTVTSKTPRMPGHLTSKAAAVWKRVVPLLVQQGTVSQADAVQLARYCETSVLYAECHAVVSAKGSTYECEGSTGQRTIKVRPEHTAMVRYCDQLAKMESKFAMTPLDRAAAGIETKPKATRPKADNILEIGI